MDLMPRGVTLPLEELPSDFLRTYNLILLRQQNGEYLAPPDIHAILEQRAKREITLGNLWKEFRGR